MKRQLSAYILFAVFFFSGWFELLDQAGRAAIAVARESAERGAQTIMTPCGHEVAMPRSNATHCASEGCCTGASVCHCSKSPLPKGTVVLRGECQCGRRNVPPGAPASLDFRFLPNNTIVARITIPGDPVYTGYHHGHYRDFLKIPDSPPPKYLSLLS